MPQTRNPPFNLWLPAEQGGARRESGSSTEARFHLLFPHPSHVCARGRRGYPWRDPALSETPRPYGRGLRSGLWLRPRCSSGGGGRGQRGSFPCCVCRCLLAILLQSPFLSAGLPGLRGGRHRKGGRGRRKEEGSTAFFLFFASKLFQFANSYFANILGDIDFSSRAPPFFPEECAAPPSPVAPRR